ncbi:MAG: divalent-cation tolerance protein CutA [Nevskiales bacterium]|nr:divalent-cation tolerance protein CutA [Nevskiales bacterium]
MNATHDALVVLITCPPDKAEALAQALVEERLAACVNRVPNVHSVYRWKGAVQQDAETLLVVKTTRSRFVALKQAVLKRHPYELPEVIAVSVDQGHTPYLDWIAESTR